MNTSNALESLIGLLDKIPSSEFVLVVESALVPLLSALAPYSTLKSHGVTSLVTLAPSATSVSYNSPTLVFLTRNEPEALALVFRSVASNPSKGVHVVVTPEIEPSVSLLATKFGVLGDLELHEWPVGFVSNVAVPDLLQLCHPQSRSDASQAVWPLVWSLDWLQRTQTGAFGRLTAIGPRSKFVATLLKQKRAESYVKEQTAFSNHVNMECQTSLPFSADQLMGYRFGYASSTFFGSVVEQVIIIDRELDLVTPLLYQTTYAGVLAETVKVSQSGVTQMPVKVSLRDDMLFRSLAESPFSEACEYLHVSAKQLQQEYRLKNEFANQNSSIAEIREVVSKLGSLQKTQRLLDTHTELASVAIGQLEKATHRDAFDLQMQILDNQLTNTQAVARIQDLVYRGAELGLVLRMLALLCLVRGGIKENVLQALFHNDLVKTYGYHILNHYHYLINRGLIFSAKNSSFMFSSSSFSPFNKFASEPLPASSPSPSEGPGNARALKVDRDPNQPILPNSQSSYSWYSINKSYKLYPSEEEEAKPYSGYIPLTARLVNIARGSMAKTLLEPETSDETFTSKNESSLKEAKLRRTLTRNSPNALDQPTTLVVIIGGVTYAEVAAITKAFQSANQNNKRVVVASDCVITGADLVEGGKSTTDFGS